MVSILIGDALERLRQLPSGCVQCAVTSPPYFGLRNYGVAGQIGLEESPDTYVLALVDVFRELRRVLRSDGVLFLNLGDSYAANRAYQVVDNKHRDVGNNGSMKVPAGLKPKDLLMIPSRVALALQADGWWLRSHIAWTKGNPMPESTKDRPTSSWESIFMLTKSQRYFWDGLAVIEPFADARQGRDGGRAPSQRNRGGRTDGLTKPSAIDPSANGGRNLRNVWAMNSQPYRGAHFAVFPMSLPERCIKAATSERGQCVECGAPWKRIVEKGEPDREHQLACGGDENGEYTGQALKDYAAAGAQNASDLKRRILEGMRVKRTVGWEPTCGCPPFDPVPCLVLDPFGGAGTTAVAASALGRDSVMIDLNPDYEEMMRARLVDALVLDFFVWIAP